MTLATEEQARIVKVAIPKDATLYGTISETVRRVPALRHMDPRAVRDVTDALVAAFGCDVPEHRIDSDPIPFCGPDAELLQAIKDLLDWTPEAGYADGFGAFALQTDDARFYFLECDSEDPAEQAVEYNDAVRDAPYLSQIVSYPVLGGKHDGRGLMGRVDTLRSIAGLPAEE